MARAAPPPRWGAGSGMEAGAKRRGGSRLVLVLIAVLGVFGVYLVLTNIAAEAEAGGGLGVGRRLDLLDRAVSDARARGGRGGTFQKFAAEIRATTQSPEKQKRKSVRARARALGKGRCANPGQPFVFYNRIPKAGSSTMLALIRLQKEALGIKWVHSREFKDRHWKDAESEEKLVSEIAKEIRRKASNRKHSLAALYDQHVRFLNFTKHGEEQPVYINVMREPLGRAVSSYYYATRGPRREEKKQVYIRRRGEQAFYTVDECLALPKSKRRCGFNLKDINLNTAFFCGHSEVCRCLNQNDLDCDEPMRREALQLAKENIVTQYAAVGITEDLPSSLALLEAVLPSHFAGVRDHVVPVVRSQHAGYAKPNATSVETLRRMLDLDVELYAFVVQRFRAHVTRCVSAALAPPPSREELRLEEVQEEGEDDDDDDDEGEEEGDDEPEEEE